MDEGNSIFLKPSLLVDSGILVSQYQMLVSTFNEIYFCYGFGLDCKMQCQRTSKSVIHLMFPLFSSVKTKTKELFERSNSKNLHNRIFECWLCKKEKLYE